MPAQPLPASASSGFTLLEVLVAFVIAALALGALFEGSLDGLQATFASARTLEAVARAQSHLAAATLPGALVPADTQGDEAGGFHWRVRVTQAAAAGIGPQAQANAQAAPLPALFLISASESWSEGGRSRAVQLDTKRVAAAPPPPP